MGHHPVGAIEPGWQFIEQLPAQPVNTEQIPTAQLQTTDTTLQARQLRSIRQSHDGRRFVKLGGRVHNTHQYNTGKARVPGGVTTACARHNHCQGVPFSDLQPRREAAPQ